MAFILGTLVSASSASAASGTPFVFMQDEIDAINDLIKKLQNELKNIHVPWVNVTGIPTGFADNIDNDTLSQISFCATNQIVKWNGTHWVCDDIGASIAPNLVVLHYEQRNLVMVPRAMQSPNLIELAVWEIVRDPTFTHDLPLIVFDTSIFGQVRQINQDSFKTALTGWYKSEDRLLKVAPDGEIFGGWNEIEAISASTDSRRGIDGTIFAGDVVLDENFDIQPRYNFIAFGTTNPCCNLGSTDGEVKDFSGIMNIHLPLGISLKSIPPEIVMFE